MESDKVYTLSSSDSEEEANLPSRQECEKRCQTFAEITGTDTALAMFYLQDRDWDVERSISDYFADGDKEAASSSPKSKKEGLQGFSWSHQSNKTQESHAKQAAHSESTSSSASLTLGASVLQPEQDGVVRILSWNIDGLDPDNLQSRTEGVCSVLLQEHPAVIFLQEVVHRSLDIIKARLEHLYTVITGDLDMVNTPVRGAYFTAMLLKKTCVELEKVRVMEYPGSLMQRDLMEVQCNVQGVPMILLTSHLESTKEYGEERQRQLKTAFEQMVAAPQDRTIIFGGDLNLRDKEVSGISAKPSGIYDLWECTGKRPEAKFTWDLKINDNKQFGTKFQPSCRFDRLYIRHCSANNSTRVINNPQAKGKEKPISTYFLSPDKKCNDNSSLTAVEDGDKNRQNQNSFYKKDNNVETFNFPLSKVSSKGEKNSKTHEKGPRVGLKPVYFELVGIQRLASCRRFPSDHWGILSHLQILNLDAT